MKWKRKKTFEKYGLLLCVHPFYFHQLFMLPIQIISICGETILFRFKWCCCSCCCSIPICLVHSAQNKRHFSVRTTYSLAKCFLVLASFVFCEDLLTEDFPKSLQFFFYVALCWKISWIWIATTSIVSSANFSYTLTSFIHSWYV